MTLIELIVAMAITALLGAGVGLLVGWVGSWSLLLSAGVGAASALVIGAIALSIAIVMGERARDRDRRSGAAGAAGEDAVEPT